MAQCVSAVTVIRPPFARPHCTAARCSRCHVPTMGRFQPARFDHGRHGWARWHPHALWAIPTRWPVPIPLRFSHNFGQPLTDDQLAITSLAFVLGSNHQWIITSDHICGRLAFDSAPGSRFDGGLPGSSPILLPGLLRYLGTDDSVDSHVRDAHPAGNHLACGARRPALAPDLVDSESTCGRGVPGSFSRFCLLHPFCSHPVAKQPGKKRSLAGRGRRPNPFTGWPANCTTIGYHRAG